MKLLTRHPGPELMDGNEPTDEALYQNYHELHTINKMLGGYRITLIGLQQLIIGKGPFSILDVGSGGGDTLKVIAAWARKKGTNVQLFGIDNRDAAIRYSENNCRLFEEIRFYREDVFQHLEQDRKYDAIVSSLFMHHFTDEQIIRLLKLMKRNSNRGFLINDLERNKLAYHSIRWLTKAFSKSYLVKHDAPLSVLRGFNEKEWWNVLAHASIANADITWQWAFRYLIVVKKSNGQSAVTHE